MSETAPLLRAAGKTSVDYVPYMQPQASCPTCIGHLQFIAVQTYVVAWR